MKIYKFDYYEKDDSETLKPIYCLTEEGAKQVKEQLDQDGVKYNRYTYGTLYDLIKNMNEWDDDSVSDGEMLDLIMELIGDLGI